jgi:MGT family glycosyltransferase
MKMLGERGEGSGKRKSRHDAQVLLDNLSRVYHLKKMKPFDMFTQKGALNLVCTSEIFQPYADSFDRQSYRFVGPVLQPRPEAPVFPFEQLEEEKPLIYISLGTMVADRASFFRLCMQAFARSNWQIVMATGKSASSEIWSDIPTNCLVQAFVPQLEILPRTSLFITHGGMNSVNEALSYNVPLVIVPQGADQHVIAKRIEQLGAGKQLSAQNLTAEKIRQTAEAILSQPAYAQAARRIGESLRAAGGSRKAVNEIQSWKQKGGIASV